MKKVNTVEFRPFNNNEHGQFHTDVKKEIGRVTPQRLGILPLFGAYSTAVTAELATIDVEKGSRYTLDIEEGDDFRDRLYRAFVLQTKANALDFHPDVEQAAHRILRIINQVGDMRKQDYNQESETLTSLVNQVKNNYPADVTTCKQGELLDKLEEANNSFIQHFGTRADEESARISGNVRQARVPVDEGFHNIALVINAMVLLNGETDYAEFIDKINYLIDYYKNTIKMRKASRKAPDKPAL